jgi:hypothetical protein
MISTATRTALCSRGSSRLRSICSSTALDQTHPRALPCRCVTNRLCECIITLEACRRTSDCTERHPYQVRPGRAQYLPIIVRLLSTATNVRPLAAAAVKALVARVTADDWEVTTAALRAGHARAPVRPSALAATSSTFRRPAHVQESAAPMSSKSILTMCSACLLVCSRSSLTCKVANMSSLPQGECRARVELRYLARHSVANVPVLQASLLLHLPLRFLLLVWARLGTE